MNKSGDLSLMPQPSLGQTLISRTFRPDKKINISKKMRMMIYMYGLLSYKQINPIYVCWYHGYIKIDSPDGCGSRILRLHLCRWVRPSIQRVFCIWLRRLDIWGMQSIASLLFIFTQPLRSGRIYIYNFLNNLSGGKSWFHTLYDPIYPTPPLGQDMTQSQFF